MISGIYQIAGAGRVYFGQSQNVNKRLSQHRALLSKGKHSNQILQNAWSKHGSSAFVFEVLLLCPLDDLNGYEQVAIDSVPKAERFNLAACAEAPGRGRVSSPDTCEKLREAQTGKTYSAESRAKMSASQKTRMLRASERARLSLANIGRPQSAETRAKRSASSKGRVFSAETKAKISKAKTRKTAQFPIWVSGEGEGA